MTSHWIAFAILFAARTAIAYQFESVGAVEADLSQSFGIDKAQVGILIGLHMLPGVFVAMPSGLIGARFSSRIAVVVGLGLMAFGGYTMTADTVSPLFVGRVVSGAGAVLLNIYLTKMVADWFPSEKLAAVLGGFVASWPLGIALALVTLPWFVSRYGPHAAMVVPALVSAACMLAFLAIYKDPPAMDQARGQLTSSWRLPPSLWARIVVAGSVWGAYNAAYVLFVTGLPALLERNGYSREVAADIVSIFGWTLMLTLPLGGVVVERFGDPRTGVMLALLAVLAGAALVVVSPYLLAGAMVVAIGIGFPAGTLLSLSTRLLEPRFRLAGMGAFFLMFYGAMAASPALAGLLTKLSGDTTVPIQVAALAIALSMLGFEATMPSRQLQEIAAPG